MLLKAYYAQIRSRHHTQSRQYKGRSNSSLSTINHKDEDLFLDTAAESVTLLGLYIVNTSSSKAMTHP